MRYIIVQEGALLLSGFERTLLPEQVGLLTFFYEPLL